MSSLASKTSAPCGTATFPAGPTSLIFSPSSITSRLTSVFVAGSLTHPFFITSIPRFLPLRLHCRERVRLGGPCNQQIQDRHASCEPVAHPFRHARLLP